jgi:arsenite-transporting ATPase
MFKPLDICRVSGTKYLFFTGKGGVGKTSISAAVAVALSDAGKKVFLVSTDPASNLQDVFEREIAGEGTRIDESPNLIVANLDPEEAARQYREKVIGPLRGKLHEGIVKQMEEQLSGACTVEIAAFDQFAKFLTDRDAENNYDHIVFDTAPTGHTLRLLNLPSAWSGFVEENTHGASCLGPLAGLDEKRNMYRDAVENLSASDKTTIILVARPEETSILEASRSSSELRDLGIKNQVLVINGVMEAGTGTIAKAMRCRQKKVIAEMKGSLKNVETMTLPLRSYNIIGVEKIRSFFSSDLPPGETQNNTAKTAVKAFPDLVDYLFTSKKRVVFVMGKGGVGKTTIAATIALSLASRGLRVNLSSTDPADHLRYIMCKTDNITYHRIDEKEELRKYRDEVLDKARETMEGSNFEYIEEDLRSPCTQEIAIFRAFADIVENSRDVVTIIDTAPTGHTLLLPSLTVK